MKIKKYQAANMAEAMSLIKGELGEDAVILNSKVTFTGGFLGFFKKRGIEVIAAIDPQETRMPAGKKKNMKTKTPAQHSLSTEQKPLPGQGRADFSPKQVGQSPVLKEMGELKKMIQQIQFSQGKETLPGDLPQLKRHLEQQDIDHETIEQLMASLMEGQNASKAEMLQKAKLFLMGKLLPEPISLFQKKYINVVGPTGVGKTTTLAKLAAESALKYRKKVAFITTDTYRIAAIDQLKTYSKILNVPLEVAYNAEDFKKAIERFSHYDAVFIDTAGRNFRNAQYVEDLQDMLSFGDDMETYLVLSLTSKQRDMEDILAQFSSIPISYFIFTKMDETSSYGAMFNMMAKYSINTAFLTNGQNVPDDLVKATPEVIVDVLLGDRYEE
ncbi:flagellar biosynthesis protein FlhF [Bacillus testis]|uniref:flagellar biosynthesis protein FlhF n=1 Tax=Bacillus testis TaxID=1622072 RepID=UPI00067F31A9|nr:flagellar biosynthesis protein FlhF [Bacillus testis]